MNFRILKFPFEITDEFEFEVPITSHVLCVQMQRGKPCVWIVCPMLDQQMVMKFRILTTGRVYPAITDSWNYAGTFQAHEGHFVGHLFWMAT